MARLRYLADTVERTADRLSHGPVTDADQRRALEVQQALSARGQHRAVSLVDALVAAAAEVRDLTILHYDADFELVAQLTGQQHEWIVSRGAAD